MNDTEIAGAAASLAAARSGPAIPAPSPGPTTMAEAEAIQLATFAALGLRRGGWKVGRADGQLFSAPMVVGPLNETEPVLTLPVATRIELEIALRFREVPPSTVLELEALPALADLVVLIEFVRTRFTGPVTAFDRIADCVSNERVVAVTAPGPWSPAILGSLPLVQLFQDGAEIARHEGAHPAAPLVPLLAAWQARCAADGVAVGAGEIVTLGSLTGVLPVPPAGAHFRGIITGLPPVQCRVLPLAA
ncbi:hypothetical protein GXW78_10445 [Roseomonas terrae]|uniref:Fumarylacetoacetase-like C-terminal domain-containing protein n=1 Tax=Neoroseomonas terrae TaxID=424799 RepID=A0ABS5EHF5_9PROT|nr:hypothetical protein [Neoroseomonas terrae]MBR0650082.1 hypothetical protein [Neoroseomonas terrae]